GVLLIALISVSITSCKDVKGLQESGNNESSNNDRIQLNVKERSNEASQNDIEVVKGGYIGFTETAKKVLDAVVHIRSTRTSPHGDSGRLPFEMPDSFKDFFGDRFDMPEDMPQQPMFGSGSGVIIDGKKVM